MGSCGISPATHWPRRLHTAGQDVDLYITVADLGALAVAYLRTAKGRWVRGNSLVKSWAMTMPLRIDALDDTRPMR